MPNFKYSLLLADADNTLFDFYAAEKTALSATLAIFGLPCGEETAKLYTGINEALWKAYERREITQEALKVERFSRLLASLDVPRLSPEDMAQKYTVQLGQFAYLMPGALAFVKAVHECMPIVLVTNGISTVQRSRLQKSELFPYIAHAVISEEIGASKPDPKMLFIAMEKMGVQDKGKVILLGDSLTADIEAARRAGLKSIWLCGPGNKHISSPADYQAETLQEAQNILLVPA